MLSWEHRSPEPSRRKNGRVRDSGTVPFALFDLYRRADYLSFVSEPKFLADPEHVLFSYFGMLLRSAMESFVDSQEQLQSFIDEQKQSYDAGKKIRGESWDPSADVRARRHFRNFLIALQTSLILSLTLSHSSLRVGFRGFPSDALTFRASKCGLNALSRNSGRL